MKKKRKRRTKGVPFLLRDVLEDLGMTQVALAIRIKIDDKHVSRIARGVQSPSWSMAVAISDALGVPLDRFKANGGQPTLTKSSPGD